jgi:hypothetical protein
MIALVLVACAGRTEAEAYAAALADGATLVDAKESCRASGAQRDACLAALVRARPAEAVSMLDVCMEIEDARWRGECGFAVAEARAQGGDRWGAVEACAGTFQDECLYHAWGFELQRLAEGKGRAVDAWPHLQDAIAYWSSLRTLRNDAVEQLRMDAWFFAHARNRPARLSDCMELPEADRAGCERGTVGFVQRTVIEDVTRGQVPARMLERACRSGDEARAVFGGFFVPDPALDDAFHAAVAEVCSAPATRAEGGRRPWNPVFGSRSMVPVDAGAGRPEAP